MWQQSNTKRAKLLDEKGLRGKTIELLSRREYSYAELEAKLLPFTEDEPLIYIVLDWMVEQGYQSDKRFACMFVRSKGLSGYGPVKIRLDLNQKGIKEHLIEHAFEENKNEVIWPDEVDRLIEKKLKAQDIADMKVKSKIMGYLQRRGFSLDQIYSGFERHQDKTTV
jgi:regulatory protein